MRRRPGREQQPAAFVMQCKPKRPGDYVVGELELVILRRASHYASARSHAARTSSIAARTVPELAVAEVT